jgi:hypothetical protein
MYGETIHEDQGRNLKQPKQYKAPLVLYAGGGGWTTKDSIVLSPPRSTTRPDIYGAITDKCNISTTLTLSLPFTHVNKYSR